MKSTQIVVGREAFSKLSAVEGVHLTPAMIQDFKRFDAKNLSHSERRAAILKKYGRGN